MQRGAELSSQRGVGELTWNVPHLIASSTVKRISWYVSVIPDDFITLD